MACEIIKRSAEPGFFGIHTMWELTIDGRLYYASHQSFLPDVCGPECMIFDAVRSEDGSIKVSGWGEKAVSYKADPDAALADAISDIEEE